MKLLNLHFCKTIICFLLFSFSLTFPVIAAQGDNVYRLKGSKLSVKVTERKYGTPITFKQKGVLWNSRGKKIADSGFKTRKGSGTFLTNYTINLTKLPADNYKYIVTTEGDIKTKHSFNIKYNPTKKMQFKKSKAVRNRNGDLFQRLYFSKAGAAGNVCHAEIYNSKGKLVHALNYKTKSSTQDFSFNWNGWDKDGGATKCPKGIYTVKYWMSGLNPKTAKFRLII